MNNGLSSLLGLNQQQRFKITNCVRGTDPFNTINAVVNWSSNTVGCSNFQLLNVCSSGVEIDNYLQTYIRLNPFQLSEVSGVHYSKSISASLLPGSYTSSSNIPDISLGSDNGTGSYTTTLKMSAITKWWFPGHDPVYWTQADNTLYYPIKLALQGCTDVTGGATAGTGTGTGSSDAWLTENIGLKADLGLSQTILDKLPTIPVDDPATANVDESISCALCDKVKELFGIGPNPDPTAARVNPLGLPTEQFGPLAAMQDLYQTTTMCPGLQLQPNQDSIMHSFVLDFDYGAKVCEQWETHHVRDVLAWVFGVWTLAAIVFELFSIKGDD